MKTNYSIRTLLVSKLKNAGICLYYEFVVAWIVVSCRTTGLFTEENIESINDMFAQFHNIKGGAKLLELQEVNDLCHAAESLLEDVKTRKIPCNHITVETLFEVEDILKKLLETLAEKLSAKKEGEPISLNSEELISPIIQKLILVSKLELGNEKTSNEQQATRHGQTSLSMPPAANNQKTESSNQKPETSNKASLPGKFLTFRLENEYYALGIGFVQDIISMMDITPVPQTANFVKGLINLRGKVIPVIDLRLMFEMSEKEYHKETCVIIVKGRKGFIGVIVDVVSEVIDVNDAEIENAPDFGKDLDTDFILGMYKKNNDVKTLIDIEKILDSSGMVVE